MLGGSSRRTEGICRSKIKEITVENFPELKRHESSDPKCIHNAEQKK